MPSRNRGTSEEKGKAFTESRDKNTSRKTEGNERSQNFFKKKI
jgi:hypothetical protein